MTTIAHSVSESMTMLRRNLKHQQRYPAMTVSTLATPVVMLLAFVGLFGETFSKGLGIDTGGGYIDYILPGMLVITIGAGMVGTAVSVNTDATEGLASRFKTMAISPASLLTGHVAGAVLQTTLSLAALIGVGFLFGFSPEASFADWLGMIGILLAGTLAMTWLAASMGLSAKNPEGASNAPLPFSLMLPFVSTAFVPLEALPSAIRWFAEYQPFTAFVESVRSLLAGNADGDYVLMALGWSAGIALFGYVRAKRLFRREPAAT